MATVLPFIFPATPQPRHTRPPPHESGLTSPGSQVTAWRRLHQDMDSSGPLYRGGGWALPAEINRCVADPAGAEPYRETIFLATDGRSLNQV